jgi:hypothetical protein
MDMETIKVYLVMAALISGSAMTLAAELVPVGLQKQ